MTDKRGDMIGRAAWEADGGIIAWADAHAASRKEFTEIALAAVAKAREIDTCDTCKHNELSWCSYHGFNTGTTLRYVGCNRHEPKGE